MNTNNIREWTVAFIFTAIAIGAQWYAFGKDMGQQEIINSLYKRPINKEK